MGNHWVYLKQKDEIIRFVFWKAHFDREYFIYKGKLYMIWSPVTYLWPQCWKTSLSSNTDKLQHKVEVLKYLEAKDGLANLA